MMAANASGSTKAETTDKKTVSKMNEDSNGKVKGASILITGANGGMAIPIVQQLLERGTKRIVMACRAQEKADDAKAKVIAMTTASDKEHEDTPNHLVEAYGGFDMCDAQAIRDAVQALPANQAAFDIVFLQAGGMVVADDWQFVSAENSTTKIEKTIFQNVVGGYVTLLELIQRNLVAPQARIVFAGGEGARGLPPLMKKPEFVSPEDLRKYITTGGSPTINYDFRQALAESKFVSALLVQTLAALDMSRTYIWFSPGQTRGTNGLDNLPNPKGFVLRNLVFPLLGLLGKAQSPQDAATKFVDCLDGMFGTQSGDILGAPEGLGLGPIVDQKPMNSSLTDEALQKELWNIINEVVGDITTVGGNS